MCRFIIIVDVVLSCFLVFCEDEIQHNDKIQVHSDDKWIQYKQEYGKYYKDQAEDEMRKSIWKKNMQFLNRYRSNSKKLIAGDSTNKTKRRSFILAPNKFSDWAQEEYERLLGLRIRSDLNKKSGSASRLQATPRTLPGMDPSKQHSDPPAYVNWAKKGFVNPVQNQGHCGSCYTFAVCGALESLYFATAGQSIILSERDLLDCSVKGWNSGKTRMIFVRCHVRLGRDGCRGGDPMQSFKYVKENGIVSYSAYPYSPHSGECSRATADIVAKISSSHILPEGDEQTLKVAVGNIGPVTVGVYASQDTFMHYKRGVYNIHGCPTSRKIINHAMLVVGYGTTQQGDDYWLIRNSFGTEWGMNGYMMLARNADNMCGIATYACYPIGLTTISTNNSHRAEHGTQPTVNLSSVSLLWSHTRSWCNSDGLLLIKHIVLTLVIVNVL